MCGRVFRYFTIQNEITRQYRRFNAEGRELRVRLTAPPPASAGAQHFGNSVERCLNIRYAISTQRYGGSIDQQCGQSAGKTDRAGFQEEGSCDAFSRKWRNLTLDTRLWILSRFMCIRSGCPWVMARWMRRRKEDICPWWLILNGV